MFNKISLYGNPKIKNLNKIESNITLLLKKLGKKVSRIDDKTDLLITIGGDGTVLKGFRMLKNENTRLLGLNFGRFGFLTTDCVDMKKLFTDIFSSGRFLISERTVIEAHLVKGKKTQCIGRALNEVLIFRKDIRILDIEIGINTSSLHVRADGLIVSTSTGSTAHSFAAGGPILTPDHDGILVVAEAPFTPSWENFICDKNQLAVKTKMESDIVIDGQIKYPLLADQKLIIKKSKEKLKIIFPRHWDFRKTVKDKFQNNDRQIHSKNR